jgi:hypothetical protein
MTPYGRIINTAQHFSTDIDYRLVSDAEMAEALARRDTAGAWERDVYANYVIEQYLQRLERRGQSFLFQFSPAADPLPFETASRINQRTLGQLANLSARHPGSTSSAMWRVSTPTRRCAHCAGNYPTSPLRVTGGTTSSRNRFGK